MATECSVGKCVGSDHLPVMLRLNNHKNIKEYPIKKTRLIGKTNWQQYSVEILKNLPADMEAGKLDKNKIDNQIKNI